MGTSETNPRALAFGGLYVKWTVAAVVLFVALEAAYFAFSGVPSLREPSLDFAGYAVGRDFLTTWMGGRSILGYGPAAWFDPAVYNASLRVMLGPAFPEHSWFYPPHFALFTWPFGPLPYLHAYIAWCVLGLACYVVASAPFVRREHLLFVAAAPGVAVCVFFGQSGFYTAALLLGGLGLALMQAPKLWTQIAAGVLFGLLTVKPELVILLPIVLLLRGRWIVIASAIVTAVALMAATGILFGWQIWAAYFEKIIPQQHWLLENGGGLLSLMVSSPFFGARLVGLPLAFAWYLQAIVSLAAVAAVTWTYWRKRDAMLSMALLVTATFLATPYVMNYDMVVLGCIVAMLLQRDDNATADHWLGLAVWLLPVTVMLAGAISVPLAPPVLMAFGGRLLWRLWREQAAKTHAVPEQREAPPLPA